MRGNLLTARQAADRLGIKLDTLYAYVSRGRLHSVTIPGSRERRYRVEDVEALLDRRAAGAPAHRADPGALMPVIGSSICLIENGCLYYRGEDAIRLSDTATLEQIAGLLWRDETGADSAIEDGRGAADHAIAISGLIERCQIRLAALAGEDLAALDLSRAGGARTGRR